jgi:hypothetical protein
LLERISACRGRMSRFELPITSTRQAVPPIVSDRDIGLALSVALN